MILWLTILTLSSPAAAADTHVELDVLYQRTCIFSRRNDISFQANRRNPLRKVTKPPGCYLIKGNVIVAKRIPKNLQAFIEIKYNRNSRTRVACEGQNDDRAYGYGSCMYPNICDKYGDIKQRLQLTIRASKKFPSDDCTGRVQAGNYTGFLKFCLPSKKEFLRQNRLTEEDLPEETGITAYIYVYLYKPINRIKLPPYGSKRVSMGHLWKLQAKQEENYARNAGIGLEDPIALSELEDPVNGFFFDSNKKAQAIGCHEIVGNVKFPDEAE